MKNKQKWQHLGQLHGFPYKNYDIRITACIFFSKNHHFLQHGFLFKIEKEKNSKRYTFISFLRILMLHEDKQSQLKFELHLLIPFFSLVNSICTTKVSGLCHITEISLSLCFHWHRIAKNQWFEIEKMRKLFGIIPEINSKYFFFRGRLSLMIIAIGNGIRNPISKPRWGCLCFTSC